MEKEQLIRHLKEHGYLKTKRVEEAFLTIPREGFVREEDREYAYKDQPLPIGYGQTISAPHMVAVMTELLEPTKEDRILEVGGGSGYQAAVLSRLVKRVYTIELQESIPRLTDEKGKKLYPIEGSIPDPLDLPTGCKFHPRCRFSAEVCSVEHPPLISLDNNRQVRCWMYHPERSSLFEDTKKRDRVYATAESQATAAATETDGKKRM